MTDYSGLKRLAEAMPDLDWDSEFEGHEQTGFCTVFVNPFEIDGEQHEGPTLIERCTAEQAEFISGAKVAVLQLIAENERLEALREIQDLEMAGMEHAKADLARALGFSDEFRWKWMLAEAEQLKAENEALRRDAERYRWLRDIGGYCDTREIPAMAPARMDAFIDAAMVKEVRP